jgi:hypothetical protein
VGHATSLPQQRHVLVAALRPAGERAGKFASRSMKSAVSALCIAACTAHFSGPAWAEDASPVSASDQGVNVCAVYGDDYEQIPGTDTCMQVRGYIRLDVTSSRGSSSGSSPAPAAPPSNVNIHLYFGH